MLRAKMAYQSKDSIVILKRQFTDNIVDFLKVYPNFIRVDGIFFCIAFIEQFRNRMDILASA